MAADSNSPTAVTILRIKDLTNIPTRVITLLRGQVSMDRVNREDKLSVSKATTDQVSTRVMQTRGHRGVQDRITGVSIMVQGLRIMDLVRTRANFPVQDRTGTRTTRPDKTGGSSRRKVGADSNHRKDGMEARIRAILTVADTTLFTRKEIIIQIRAVTDLSKDTILPTRGDMDLNRDVQVLQIRVGGIRDNHVSNTVPEIIMALCNRRIHTHKIAISHAIAAGIQTRTDSTPTMRIRNSITQILAAEDTQTNKEDTGTRKAVIIRKEIMEMTTIIIPAQIMNLVAA
jgi:hypothetical protein